LPSFPKVPSSGFGYPLDGVSCSDPQVSFSTLNALELRPSKLFSSPWVGNSFEFPRPPSRFLTKPSRTLYRRLSDCCPQQRSCTPDCTPLLLRGSGAHCFLGLLTSQVLSQSAPKRKDLSLFCTLPRLTLLPLTEQHRMRLRAFGTDLAAFPSRGADLSGLFHRPHLPPFQTVHTLRTIFSSRLSSRSYE
jgi:hypothetical protein